MNDDTYHDVIGSETYWDEPYDYYHNFEQDFGQDWYDEYYEESEAGYHHHDFDYDDFDMDEDQYEGYHQNYEDEGPTLDFDDENETNYFSDHRYGEGSAFDEGYLDIDDNHEYQWQRHQAYYCACDFPPIQLPKLRRTDHIYFEHPRLQIPEPRSPIAMPREKEPVVGAYTATTTQDQSPSDLFRKMFWRPAATASSSDGGNPSSPRRSITCTSPSSQKALNSTPARPAELERSPRLQQSPWNGSVGFLAPPQN